MKTQLRIVAGSLRGRKLSCTVGPGLRPIPQMVREALFSILGNAVPGRQFFDLFAGTGAVGLEALSRGAVHVTFVEHDPRIASDIERHLETFGVGSSGRVDRSDAYRWVERWRPPDEPVNVFLGPPYPDLERRPEALLALIGALQEKLAPGSVLTLQAEQSPVLDGFADRASWDTRRYGRNMLLIWVKELPPAEVAST
jgi:16S rRNA (guanine(966)-N(2))-methyltransferase RsmD